MKHNERDSKAAKFLVNKLKAWSYWAELNPIDDDQKEMCAAVKELFNQISILTKERDLCVEALEKIDSYGTMARPNDYFYIAREALQKLRHDQESK